MGSFTGGEESARNDRIAFYEGHLRLPRFAAQLAAPRSQRNRSDSPPPPKKTSERETLGTGSAQLVSTIDMQAGVLPVLVYDRQVHKPSKQCTHCILVDTTITLIMHSHFPISSHPSFHQGTNYSVVLQIKRF